jgi:hypothetical protein
MKRIGVIYGSRTVTRLRRPGRHNMAPHTRTVAAAGRQARANVIERGRRHRLQVQTLATYIRYSISVMKVDI